MPYLRLQEGGSGAVAEFNVEVVRLGRHPGLELSVRGQGSQVVSSEHAWFFFRDGRWWIEDRGSRNGTYVDGERLLPGRTLPVQAGTVVSLAQSGPQFRVEMASRQFMGAPVPPVSADADRSNGAELDDTPGEGSPAPELPVVRIILEDIRNGGRFEATGSRIRLGRGSNCEVRPRGADQTLVSRTHAEIYVRPDGTVLVRDERSVNGTYVNGWLVEGERELKKHDQIALGEDGPVLWIERISVSIPGVSASPWRRLIARILPGRHDLLPS